MPAVTVKGVDKLQRALTEISKRSVPFAARDLVNGMAFEGRRIWGLEMQKTLTLRNAYTRSRALVQKASTLRMRDMYASLGHPEDYMRQLEEGGRERADKTFRPIPTEVAAGQAKGSTMPRRKRAVKRANIITKLSKRIPGGGKSGSRKSRNARAVRSAIKTGRGLALLDLGKRKGIFRVKGGKKGLNISMLYDLTRRSTPIPRKETLKPTLSKVLFLAPMIAERALQRQLDRLKAT